MKPDELLKRIEKGRIDPVYFLSGDDEFSKEEALRKLISATIEPGTEAFSLDLLNGETTDAATILTLAATVPMLSERRIVVVRAFHRLSQGDREAVIDYADHPPSSACLVLITPKVDLRTKLYARLNKSAVSVIFYPMDLAWDLPRMLTWLQVRAEHRQKKISTDARQALIDSVGVDLGVLASELDKLAIYVGDRPAIESADVEAVMGQSRTGDVFDLAQAIGEKDLPEACRSLSRLIDAGESPIGMVAILFRHMTILWKIRFMKQEKRTDDEIKKTLKLGWGFDRNYPRYLAQTKLLTGGTLLAGFEALLQADLALKTSAQSERLVMQRLLYNLCI